MKCLIHYNLFILTILYYVNGAFNSEKNQNDKLVFVTQGAIGGKIIEVEDMKVYKFNVPYAEVPKRFKHPLPVKYWGKKNYFTPKECHQKNSLFQEAKQMDEDCLYLTIYAPLNAIDGDEYPLPVVVFIEGHMFQTNSVFLNSDDCVKLAVIHNVIIVVLQYRVGSLGFFGLNHPDVDKNVGLYDQMMALTWINEEIRFFGGDHSSITLFGHGSGAACVGLLLISSQSTNLFNTVALFSGSPLADWVMQSREDAHANAHHLGQISQCNDINTNEIYKCLQRINASLLVNSNVPTDEAKFYAQFRVTVDYDLVADEPEQLLLNNDFKLERAILVGYSQQDALHYLMDTLKEENKKASYEIPRSKLGYYISKIFPTLSEFVKEFITFDYCKLHEDVYMHDIIHIASESMFMAPAIKLVDTLVKNNKTNVYLFKNSRSPLKNTTNFKEMSGHHGDIIPIMFGASLDNEEQVQEYQNYFTDFFYYDRIDWIATPGYFSEPYNFRINKKNMGIDNYGNLLEYYYDDERVSLWNNIIPNIRLCEGTKQTGNKTNSKKNTNLHDHLMTSLKSYYKEQEIIPKTVSHHRLGSVATSMQSTINGTIYMTSIITTERTLSDVCPAFSNIGNAIVTQ